VNNDLFSKRFNRAIKSKNITQKELAKLTNLSPAAINQYVKGIYQPNRENLKKIANALEVDIVWLQGYDKDEIPPNGEKFKRVIEICDQLNATGLDRLIEYGKDILGKYGKEQ